MFLKFYFFLELKFHFVGKTRDVTPNKKIFFSENSGVKILTKEFGKNIG